MLSIPNFKLTLFFCLVARAAVNISPRTCSISIVLLFRSFADNIVFCDGVRDKLVKIAHILNEDAQSIVFIDDRYMRLLEEFSLLDQNVQDQLRRHVVLVAFGGSCLPDAKTWK